MTRMILIEERF